MVTKNTWGKGLNSDISKLKTSNETYLDALNMTIITQDGDSSFALQSTKGTQRTFTLPTPGPTYRFEFDGFTGTCNFQFTISGVGTVTFSITNIETRSTEYIANKFNEEFESLYVSGTPDVKAFYNSNYVVIYDYSTLLSITTATNCTYQDWTYVGGQYILGWGYSDNILVVVSGDVNVDTPDPENHTNTTDRLGSVGCIWYIPIDNVTGQAIKPDGTKVLLNGTLNPKDFLVYKEMLNLSRYYNIYKSLKCRKETDKILRVVFTDFYNDIKTINILQDQVQALPVELINILPVHRPKKPILTKVIPGGFLPTGRYQIWYQLSSFQGALSTISPLSNLITIGDQSDIDEYSGAVVGTVSTKSIQCEISDLDTNYDLVRLGYTVYQVNGLAESFYFDELPIPSNGTVSTVLNGNENNIPIEDQTLLANVNKPPSVAKTIDVVKNKLIIANTKVNQFDVDFDARAYRFNSSRAAALYNSGNAYGSPKASINYSGNFINIDGVVSALNYNNLISLIQDDFDLINPFNDENPSNPLNNGNWGTFSQFKFQSDGVTLGGTGPNIAYKFVTKPTIDDTNLSANRTQQPLVNPLYSISETYDFGYYEQSIDGSFLTMRSPYYDSLFWGYARGEVYRFGIVFYDLYGYASFVKWIGDIKFPFVTDVASFSDAGLSTVTSSDELQCNQLGIEFRLNTSSEQFQAIKDKISGWSFVRVNRTLEDKTRLGIGMMDNVASAIVFNLGGSCFINSNICSNSSASNGGNPTVSTNVKLLYIPSFQKSIDNQFKPGDYIDYVGEYDLESGNAVGPGAFSFYRKFSLTPSFTLSFNTIEFKWSVERSKSGNFIPADPGNGLNFPYCNMSTNDVGAALANQFTSSGNKVDLVTLDSNVGIAGGNKKYCVSYNRYLDSQYGGNLAVSRFNNTYISTGHFQPYNINDEINPSQVFGGDVVVVNYVYQTHEKNILEDSGWNVNPLASSIRTALFFPAESHVFNPHFLVYNSPFTSAGRSSNRLTDDPIYEENIPVNLAYNQENNTVVFVSPPLVDQTIKKEPFTIYASPDKIDGEIVDSWRNFRTNNFIAVNGNYGQINRIIEFKDKLYFYQAGAIGIAAIDERVLINDGSTEQTQLGTGGVLARYDYLSTETGVMHQFAVEKSGGALYHYDALLAKAFRIGEGVTPISDIKGLIGVFNNFDPTIKEGDQLFTNVIDRKGVHLCFDSRTNKIYFTLLGSEDTLTVSYNELIDAFDSRHSFTPTMYLNMRNFFISTDPGSLNNNIELHNVGRYGTYYGAVRPSTVKFRNNLDSPDLVKVFDNVWINSEVIDNGTLVNESITTLQATNDYQDTGVLTTLNKIKPLLRTWRWNSLRNSSDKRRMYDKYIDIELTYTPQGTLPNKKFILHDVVIENSMRSTIKPK